jgi:hypothetical protein
MKNKLFNIEKLEAYEASLDCFIDLIETLKLRKEFRKNCEDALTGIQAIKLLPDFVANGEDVEAMRVALTSERDVMMTQTNICTQDNYVGTRLAQAAINALR